ncbi:glycosyltransferase 1 domain containing 1 [Balamuthia mandrillaris]
MGKRRSFEAPANGESGKEDGPRRSVFLLPSGLRAVKDPLFLLDAFCAWHDEEKEVRGREVFLLIIGPVLDEQYGDAVLRKVESLRGIIYHPSIPRRLLHLLVMKSIAVVNSSRSEGLSNVLVEAMLLGTPVVARRIQGNESVIEHETTGLLFDTPHDFVAYAKRLLDSSDLRKALSSRAKAHANEKYSLENEGRAYRSLFSCLRSAQAHPVGSSL